MHIRMPRRHSSVRCWGALVVALALCAGPALAEPPATGGGVDDDVMASELATWERAADAALRDHAEALAAGGDADDKLAAFLLYPMDSTYDAQGAGRRAGPRPAHVQQWLLDAAADPAAPSPSALWRVASNCPIEPARCDAEGALERLVRLDPGNGAVWLLKAQRAHARGDRVDSERWFTRAADAPRIDFYDRDQGRLLLRSAAGVELPPMGAKAAAAQRQLSGSDSPATTAGWLDASLFGRWMAWAIPALQWASSQCPTGAAALTDAGQLDRCRRLHARMAEQATMTVTQLYALAKAIQLQPELPSLREAYRQALWQYAQATQVLTPFDQPPPADYLRRVLADGELATWATLLEAAGIALVAPAGWLPDHPGQRELILTGTRSD
jgi:hypothetical protein